jgi:hypothetical protein
LLFFGQPAGVLPGGLHCVRGYEDVLEGQRRQQRLEVGDLAGFAGLGDLVLADHRPGLQFTGVQQGR